MTDKLFKIVDSEDNKRAGIECRCGWKTPLRRKAAGTYLSGVVVQEAQVHLSEKHAD